MAAARNGSAASSAGASVTLCGVEESWDVGALEVFSCVHAAGLRLGRHAHERASLQIGMRGICDELVDGRPFELGPGVALFKPMGVHHSNSVRAVDYASVIVGFPSEFKHLPPGMVATSGGAVLDVSRRLVAELATRAPGWRAIVEGSVLELLGYLGRSARLSDKEKWLDAAADLALEGRSLSEIAAAVARSPSTVARAFKARFGASVGAFCRTQRLHGVRTALAASKPLSEIALEFGFCDQSHLTRCFSSYFGISPARYRREARRASTPRTG